MEEEQMSRYAAGRLVDQLLQMRPGVRLAALDAMSGQDLATVREAMIVWGRTNRLPPAHPSEGFKSWRGCRLCGTALGRDDDREPEMGWSIVSTAGSVLHVPWFDPSPLRFVALCGILDEFADTHRFVRAFYPGAGNPGVLRP